MKTTVFIKGMHCASCKALIEDACKEIKGVSSCAVDYATGKTEIEHDSTIDWEALKKEIATLGSYKVDVINKSEK